PRQGAGVWRSFHVSARPAVWTPGPGHRRARIHRAGPPLPGLRAMDALAGQLGSGINRGGAQTRGSQMSAVRLQIARATSLLILSPRAGSMNPDVEAKIRKAFDGSLIVEFDPRMDLDNLITRTSSVILAWSICTISRV